MSIEIKTVASLAHLNVRKEGPDDAKATAIDLKLSGLVDSKILDTLLCGDDANGMAEVSFWDTDGDPRFLSLKECGFTREIHSACIDIEGVNLRGCTVRKFSFKAMDGYRAMLTFSISSSDFPSNAIAILAEQLDESNSIHLWVPQGDMFAAASSLDDMAREDGTSVTLSTGAGDVLATFGDGPDPMYEQAMALVIKNDKASISFVQRSLKLGYNRAARLIEAMEVNGVVSPIQGNGARSVIKEKAA